jgi:hypothetical protein
VVDGAFGVGFNYCVLLSAKRSGMDERAPENCRGLHRDNGVHGVAHESASGSPMSESRRTISDWAMVGTLILTIIGHAIYTEGRLSRLEQKVDDLVAFIKSK